MKDLFIPQELAIIARQKGFNEPCIAFFDSKNEKGKEFVFSGLPHYNRMLHKEPVYEGLCCAPLYQQIVDWFRDKHNIQIKIIAFDGDSKVCWYYECQDLTLHKSKHTNDLVFNFKVNDPNIHSSYYEALNNAIEETLKSI